MKSPRIALAALVLMPFVAVAATAPHGKSTRRFSGKGQLGLLASQGNAQGKSANAALNLVYRSGPWKHTLNLAAQYGQSQGVVSTERWSALWQSSRKISSDAFAFGSLRFEHDMFNGFQYQASATAGLGYTVIHTKSTTLSTQLGAGYTVQRPETLTDIALATPTHIFVERTALPSQRYAIGTLGVDYEQALTSTTTLSDKMLANAGSLNTMIINTLALTVKVSTRLALSLAYDIQDNTHPPGTIKHLDSTETANLVYAF